MEIVRAILGLALVVMGRRLFWLLVGAAGFVAGLWVATELVQSDSQWVVGLLAFSGGVLGAMLAVFLQGVAVWAVGFLAGGYVGLNLLPVLQINSDQVGWVAFLVGGILGAVLIASLFDWALILLSVVVGATLVMQALTLDAQTSALAYLGLVAVGVLLQSRDLRHKKPS